MSNSSTAFPRFSKTLAQVEAGREAPIPPHSNTGVSSPSMTDAADVGCHAAACRSRVSPGHATLIDTVSLVFPLLALVPDYDALSIAPASDLTPRQAMALPLDEQRKRAVSWWPRDRDLPAVDDVVIPAWVNHLYRVTLSTPDVRGLECDIHQVSSAFDWMAGAFGMTLSPRSRGRNGFTFSADLVPAQWDFYRDGQPPSLGHVAWGGLKDRFGQLLAQVHLTGQGCGEVSLVDGWGRFHAWAVDLGAHLTRCDVAFDDFEGEHGDVSAWVDRYDAGAFAIRQNPSFQHIYGTTGHTFYVGSRQSGKLLRAYAKGQQLGDPDSPWVRLEVELRNSQRLIPLAILIDPDSYFAGAYPALADIDLSATPEPIATLVRNVAAASLTCLIHHAKRSYGKLIHVMRAIGYAPAEIVERLIQEGTPSRLASVSFIQALDSLPHHPVEPPAVAA